MDADSVATGKGRDDLVDPHDLSVTAVPRPTQGGAPITAVHSVTYDISPSSNFSHRGRRRAKCRSLVGALSLVALTGAGLVAATPSMAAAYPSADVVVSGHGYGHGIGMGQWGAFGYATGQDGGLGPQTYSWIVNHYYGPATLVSTPGNDSQTIKVAMTEDNTANLIATAPGGVTVPGSANSPAVMMVPQGAGTGDWNIHAGASCQGPWTPAPVATVPSAQALTQAASGGAVQLCSGSGGAQVMGSLQGLYNSADASRVINIVPLGAYLDAVVPSESSSGWATFGGPGPQGQDWGFQELEAQAVAARSYVLSTPLGYGGYADTCDQTCQSYPGIVNETAVATLAVSNTAGQVMEFSGGQIATTEYSASTGGYTASSAEQSPFTPVPDAGDAVCIPGSGYSCNPNHNWEVSIPVTTVQSVLPQIGSLQSIAITGRNGYGDWGGRVTTMVVSGSSGSATLTGSQFAGDFNLPSNWFTVTSNPSGGVGGYQLAAADGGIFTFGNAGYFGSMGGQHLNQPVVGMAPTNDHGGYWEVATDGGIFTFGDAGYFGSTGNIHLNAPIVGMAADPATGGYWLVASDGGIFAFNAPFYGSMGGQHLNQPIVGMAAVPGGTGYWLVSSDGGIFSFGTGAGFYGSTGNISLVQPVVGMAVAPGGNGYWLSAADGGVFTFGPGASFYGSDAGQPNVAGTVGLLPTATGGGYLDITGSGRVTNFGDAPQFGDLTTVLSSYSGHVVAGATTPG